MVHQLQVEIQLVCEFYKQKYYNVFALDWSIFCGLHCFFFQQFIAVAASASANLINAEQEKPKPSNVVCENGVCTIQKPSEPVNQASISTPEGDQSTVSAEEKIERAKKLLEAKRLEKELEEKEVSTLFFQNKSSYLTYFIIVEWKTKGNGET